MSVVESDATYAPLARSIDASSVKCLLSLMEEPAWRRQPAGRHQAHLRPPLHGARPGRSINYGGYCRRGGLVLDGGGGGGGRAQVVLGGGSGCSCGCGGCGKWLLLVIGGSCGRALFLGAGGGSGGRLRRLRRQRGAPRQQQSRGRQLPRPVCRIRRRSAASRSRWRSSTWTSTSCRTSCVSQLRRSCCAS